jgi:hypothetical protein
MTTDITHEDLIDLGYVCKLAKSTDYPLSYEYDKETCIDSFIELLWWNEEDSGNECELDGEEYYDLVYDYIKENWSVISTYINFED